MNRFAFITLLCLAAPVAAQEAPVIVQYHSPAAAGLFSFVIPGAGQIYNGEVGKGVAFFGVAITMGVLMGNAIADYNDECRSGPVDPGTECSGSPRAGFFLLGILGNTTLSIVDAVKIAKRLNAAAVQVTPTVTAAGRVGLAVSFSP